MNHKALSRNMQLTVLVACINYFHVEMTETLFNWREVSIKKISNFFFKKGWIPDGLQEDSNEEAQSAPKCQVEEKVKERQFPGSHKLIQPG